MKTSCGSLLFAVTPAPGHVNPLLAITCDLRDRGYSIIFSTAEVFRRQVEAADLPFIPFRGFANFDYRNLDEPFPERKNFKPGPDLRTYDSKHIFAKLILRASTMSYSAQMAWAVMPPFPYPKQVTFIARTKMSPLITRSPTSQPSDCSMFGGNNQVSSRIWS